MADHDEEPPAPDSPATARELADGLRFVHTMEMQTRRVLSETTARIEGLVATLNEAGVLDDAPGPGPSVGGGAAGAIQIQVARQGGKYWLTDLPQIDCAGLLHLCQARCCRTSFPLGFEDLEEGALRWEFGRPYLIRRREDGVCVHNDAQTLRCTVYAKRPCRCRTYDCRSDPAVWLDFERRIPAPDPDDPSGAAGT